MPVCTLTARMIENIQPTPGKRVEYADTKARGLTLAPADALPLADARDRARDLSRHTVQINTDDPTHLTETLLRDVGASIGMKPGQLQRNK